mmetsp:Transcript_26087/g.49548  ORF Transcript_26087/g.49548 Transcript_26087/m.49548 type:complete len:201 (-) Transcript_26087:206-808(-)
MHVHYSVEFQLRRVSLQGLPRGLHGMHDAALGVHHGHGEVGVHHHPGVAHQQALHGDAPLGPARAGECASLPRQLWGRGQRRPAHRRLHRGPQAAERGLVAVVYARRALGGQQPRHALVQIVVGVHGDGVSARRRGEAHTGQFGQGGLGARTLRHDVRLLAKDHSAVNLVLAVYVIVTLLILMWFMFFTFVWRQLMFLTR